MSGVAVNGRTSIRIRNRAGGKRDLSDNNGLDLLTQALNVVADQHSNSPSKRIRVESAQSNSQPQRKRKQPSLGLNRRATDKRTMRNMPPLTVMRQTSGSQNFTIPCVPSGVVNHPPLKSPAWNRTINKKILPVRRSQSEKSTMVNPIPRNQSGTLQIEDEEEIPEAGVWANQFLGMGSDTKIFC